MPRNHRTPRPLIILRVGLSTWMCIFLGALILGVVPGIGVLFLVLAVVAVFMMIAAVIVRIGGWMLYGDNPEYRDWVADGGDPYFDMIPPPFNRDSWTVRATGLPEPVTDFEPPGDWRYQCQHCGARNPNVDSVCWHCGAGEPQRLEVQCGGCGGTFREATAGDLERTGVTCPWCGVVVAK